MLFLFDTCTSRCAYCDHALSGKSLDNSQLLPYKDRGFIDKFLSFFEKRTTRERKWLLMLLGGEPLLVPNLDYILHSIHEMENKVAFYTSLNISESHSSFKSLLKWDNNVVDYIMASFHPDADEFEESFFTRMILLKNSGHSFQKDYPKSS